MSNKVILILSDGMKGDSVLKCNNAFAKKCVEQFPNALDAQAVMPSVTLPCHMSLFHSVPPERHGILTNTYTPQVRPVKSLINLLAENQKACSMFYNWEELRDISLPGGLIHSLYTENDLEGKGDEYLTDAAIDRINTKGDDFLFLYLGSTDHVGHTYGWESDIYQKAINHSWDCIEKVYNSIPKDYTIIVTSDHGGHSRGHGDNIPEDMTIPILILSNEFSDKNIFPSNATIMDIAPTITKIIGVNASKDWEGNSLL